ncbi:MAG: hypothetical protein NT007_03435 [Candidatus Kapabacteria bacterium]|nr:hypothetical protein [Candidatus Kapabacteria bacterium]
MANYFPTKDADFIAWLANFLTVANINLVPLGLIACHSERSEESKLGYRLFALLRVTKLLSF